MRAWPGLGRSPLQLVGKALGDLRVRCYPVESAGTLPDGSGLYPLDLRAIFASPRFDSDGVIVTAGQDGRDYRNPVSAGLYALGRHTAGQVADSGCHADTGRFLVQARSLLLTQVGCGGWRYPVPVPRYRVAPGWYSAIAQGLAISVLLRAHDLTGERSYVGAASRAAELLLRPLAEGGCAGAAICAVRETGSGRPRARRGSC